MSDNLRANQTCFNKKFKEHFSSNEMFSCKHPVSNEEFKSIYPLYEAK